MVSRNNRTEQFELLPRTSHDSTPSDDSTSDYYTPPPAQSRLPSWIIWPLLRIPLWPARSVYAKIYRYRSSRGFVLHYLSWIFAAFPLIITVLVTFTLILWPLYSYPPSHYRTLRKSCQESKEPGRGNISREKIYIAATLYDPGGSLVAGEWGRAVLELVDLLGFQNVHLSIYENDADESAKAALQEMAKKAKCTRLICYERSYKAFF